MQAAAQSQAYATVYRIAGEVTATAANGQTAPRKLAEGDPVFVEERVESADTAEVVLRTADAGLIAVRPGAKFVVEQYVARGDAGDHVSLRLLVGGLRMISGWIARLNPPGDRVMTRSAYLGVRGTDHEPYVLDAALAQRLAQPQGTYDKVNRGGTTLEANGHTLDIDPGQVGFARDVQGKKPRALMTLLLPVLLDKVPDFYVPGRFDAELDQLSQQADVRIPQQLAQQQRALRCGAADVAQTWVTQLDDALGRRDAAAVLKLFAPDVAVSATVLGQDGKPSQVTLTPDEFVRSSLAAIDALSDYHQRRLSIESELVGNEGCDQVRVRSLVIEQGRQGERSYRFESTETYMLHKRGADWVAVSAATTQR